MTNQPFADLPPTASQHFKLHYFAAVLHLLDELEVSFGTREAALEQFPFLAGYQEELSCFEELGRCDAPAETQWWDALHDWEATVHAHLPLRALREAAGLDDAELAILLTIGLIEEDARFGSLFEILQATPAQYRPTVGLLTAWWRDPGDGGPVRRALRRLRETRLVEVVNPEAPRVQWGLQATTLLWDTLRGDNQKTPAPWLRFQDPSQLPETDKLILPESIRQALRAIPPLMVSGEVQALIVRGPQHNGRRTMLAAVARAMNRGLLEIVGLSNSDDDRWRLVGPMATLLHAMPLFVLDPAPGETARLPSLECLDGPLGLVLGKQGGVSGPAVERAITVALDMPDGSLRRGHWQESLGDRAGEDLSAISERFRMTGGHIRRAARLARSYATLAGHSSVRLLDVQEARRALNRQALDTLAIRLSPVGDWSQLAVGSETLHELRGLENRCRHRERLQFAVGSALDAQWNTGVRALFSGPSGTGKTLAARLLAATLQMDLYRLDLSTLVNKYIGETEKNLNQLFARAEELDVILLLDEGDSLLTQRTNVQTANDRYANLETNYLLQRLETFEGILVVTTNAGDRIDRAFQRRMDVVIDFRAPDTSERWAIWQMHLPAVHAIDRQMLQELATRCALSGGQIRNAVLHASLLALDNGQMIRSTYLEEAVFREYRKAGAVCPLRRADVPMA